MNRKTEQFVERVITRSKEKLMEYGSLEPILFVDTPKGMENIKYELPSDDEKVQVWSTLGARIAEMQAYRIVMLHEVFYTDRYKAFDDEADPRSPAECPDRKEGLIVLVATKDLIEGLLIPFSRNEQGQIVVEHDVDWDRFEKMNADGLAPLMKGLSESVQ